MLLNLKWIRTIAAFIRVIIPFAIASRHFNIDTKPLKNIFPDPMSRQLNRWWNKLQSTEKKIFIEIRTLLSCNVFICYIQFSFLNLSSSLYTQIFCCSCSSCQSCHYFSSPLTNQPPPWSKQIKEKTQSSKATNLKMMDFSRLKTKN